MEILKDSFFMLKYLTIARMNYNWFDIQRCMSMFPSLQELSVSFNIVNIIHKPIKDENLMKICKLTLEGNLISNWDDILKLGSLPRQVNNFDCVCVCVPLIIICNNILFISKIFILH